MFQLTDLEHDSLMSETVTSKVGRGQHRKYLPFVFTEQGVAMLSGVLSSERAVKVNIAIMRAFVKMREMLETHKDLAAKLDKLEGNFMQHDEQFKAVFAAICGREQFRSN